jgi:hypothetical protein
VSPLTGERSRVHAFSGGGGGTARATRSRQRVVSSRPFACLLSSAMGLMTVGGPPARAQFRAILVRRDMMTMSGQAGERRGAPRRRVVRCGTAQTSVLQTSYSYKLPSLTAGSWRAEGVGRQVRVSEGGILWRRKGDALRQDRQGSRSGTLWSAVVVVNIPMVHSLGNNRKAVGGTDLPPRCEGGT